MPPQIFRLVCLPLPPFMRHAYATGKAKQCECRGEQAHLFIQAAFPARLPLGSRSANLLALHPRFCTLQEATPRQRSCGPLGPGLTLIRMVAWSLFIVGGELEGQTPVARQAKGRCCSVSGCITPLLQGFSEQQLGWCEGKHKQWKVVGRGETTVAYKAGEAQERRVY